MKRTSGTMLSAFALASLLSVAQPARADDLKTCSNHAVAGKWSYRIAGSLLSDPNNEIYSNDFPVAGVGTFTLEKSGKVSGGGPYKSGCCVAQITFSGTYTVNGDCEGEVSVELFQDGSDVGPFTLEQVFGNNANDVHWITTDPYHVLNIDGQRLFHD